MLAWKDKSPEEKTEIIRQERERAAQKEIDDMDVSKAFKDLMAGFQKLQDKVQVMSAEQEAAFVWRTQIAPCMGAAGLPERHRVKITDWKCKPQQRVFERVSSMCNGKGAVIALIGHRGTGKTTIPAQIIRERVEAEHAWDMATEEQRATMSRPKHPGRYIKLLRLGAAFKPLFAEFGSINGPELAEHLSRWVSLPFLVIDEIHEVDDMKTHDRLLVDLIDRRYARKRDTIIIDNREEAEFRAKTNPSILSRISEHGMIIPCEWKSWRTN
jgi:DNA replication protein DnaC